MAYRTSDTICAVIAAVVAFAGFAVAMPACSASGEGDRCTFFPVTSTSGATSTSTVDVNAINGTDECQNGLICIAATPPDFPYDRCCPPNPANATVPACQPIPTLEGGTQQSGRDASTDGPSDGAEASDGSSGEGGDSSSEASSTDGSTDAPSDGKADSSG